VTGGVALVFPGQGSQFVGMACDLAEAYAVVAQTLREADEAAGVDLWAAMREGPAEALTATSIAQPAILAHSVAIWRLLAEAGVRPALAAGHSLGEYSALVAAGVFDFPAAVALVRRRGELMAAAGEHAGGAMAAVIGLGPGAVEELIREAAVDGTVVVANINAPEQVVVSGEDVPVATVGRLAQQAGARVRPLQVSGAFHSPLMATAAEELAVLLDQMPLATGTVPVYSNVDAMPRCAGEDIRAALKRQVTGSVRWSDSVQAMVAAGVEVFVEVGPGSVLTKLMRRIAPEVTAVSTSDVAGVQAVLDRLA